MGRKVGIDFGTSNSGVSVSDGKNVRLVPIEQKNPVPEVVKTILYITRDQKVSIGQDAVETYYRQNINRLRRYVKKWAGEVEYHGSDGMFFVTDVYSFVDELLPGRLLQFLKTALRSEGFLGTQIFDRYYSVGEIISLYLGELKKRSEDILGEPITGVTLGRPVHFFDNTEQDQKSQEILLQSAIAAGFENVEFEFEPIAAALYYELSLTRPQDVLIFDFGGGTLDITIMRLGDPNRRIIYGNGGIGIAGSDFDRSIIQKRLLGHFGKGRVDHIHDISLLIDAVSDWMALPELSIPRIRHKLLESIKNGYAPARLKTLESLIFNDLAFSFYNSVEKSKIDLSTQGATIIRLEDRDIDLWELYTRWQFEKDIREYQYKIEKTILDTIAASGLEIGQIEAVVKTGGSSNIPLFTELLNNLFGKEKVKSSNTFSSVCAGLGLRASEGL